nr:hypothetical protein BaRGS_001277 [Batillaria attramentaria]
MCFVDPVRHCSVFNILENNSNDQQGENFTCRLSQDHRKLEFLGEHSKKEPIPVEKIESVQIVASESDLQGNRLGTGIAMRYTIGGNGSSTDTEIIKMTVDEGASRKQGMAWIAAMQKTFKVS